MHSHGREGSFVQHQSWWNHKKSLKWEHLAGGVHRGWRTGAHPTSAITDVMGNVYYLIFSSMHGKQVPGAPVLFHCTISSKPCMEYNCLAPEWLGSPDWRGQEQVGTSPPLKSQLATLVTGLYSSLISMCPACLGSWNLGENMGEHFKLIAFRHSSPHWLFVYKGRWQRFLDFILFAEDFYTNKVNSSK